MAKFTYSDNEGLKAEFECETQRELWGQVSRFQEVFCEKRCGKCDEEDLRFSVRDHEENQYYELRCQGCNAKLSFGCHKKGGGLYPRRKDAEGNWIQDNGWLRWDKEQQCEI